MVQRGKKSQKLRFSIQLGFFILVALVVTAHSAVEMGLSIPFIEGASLHAICPFGGVVTLYELIAEGSFVQKIHQSSLILALLVLVTSLLFGPVFCGWICPFGTFQEWTANIGRKIFGRRYGKIIPSRLDSVLRYLRYLVLLYVIIATAVSAKLIFSSYDPYYALFNFWTGEVALTAFIALGVVLLLSLVTERPFCKYACPYGALLGLTNRFRLFSIKRRSQTCIDCGACDRACPMGIEISTADTVSDHQCISCLRCTSEYACPVDQTVVVKTKRMHTVVTQRPLALITLVLFLGGIGLSFTLGWWQTSSLKVPNLIKEGELAGSYDPADIRGSYTFSDIERNFAVPSAFLADAFFISSSDPGSISAKDVELAYGEMLSDSPLELGTDSVRYMVSLYLGYPYQAEQTTGLPVPGLGLLLESGRIDRAAFDRLVQEVGVPIGESRAVIGEEPADVLLEIKGNTSFAEILDAGITREQIEEILGMPIPSADDTARDVCLEAGVEFSVFRERILELLDRS
jgi:polyferredoxin